MGQLLEVVWAGLPDQRNFCRMLWHEQWRGACGNQRGQGPKLCPWRIWGAVHEINELYVLHHKVVRADDGQGGAEVSTHPCSNRRGHGYLGCGNQKRAYGQATPPQNDESQRKIRRLEELPILLLLRIQLQDWSGPSEAKFPQNLQFGHDIVLNGGGTSLLKNRGSPPLPVTILEKDWHGAYYLMLNTFYLKDLPFFIFFSYDLFFLSSVLLSVLHYQLHVKVLSDT